MPLFVASFVLLFLLQSLTYWSMTQADEAKAQLQQSSDIKLRLEMLISHVKDSETGMRGYVITSQQQFLEPYKSALTSIPEDKQKLHQWILDGSQLQNLTVLEKLTTKQSAFHKKILDIQNTLGSQAAQAEVAKGQGKSNMDAIRTQAEQMIQYENNLIATTEQKAEHAAHFSKAVYIIGFLFALCLQGLAFFFVVRENKKRQEAETQLQHHVDELDETNTTLHAVNTELESFAYSVSHDLRSPLRGLDGLSLALIEDYGEKIDDTGRALLHRIRSESQRMGQLIDGILALSRLTRGDFSRQTLDLSKMAESTLEALKTDEPNRYVKTTVQPDLKAEGDPRLMDAVMQNLLANAWKFTAKKDEPSVQFGAKQQDGKTVYFVKDNGAGFDMAYVGKLFGAFQRLHTVQEFPGTGIGLATVQRIIHRHGGTIWAEGQLNQGATFYFTLN